MKGFVLCACVLILAFQSSNSSELKQQLRNAIGTIDDDSEACMAENDLIPSDIYSEENIMNNLHTNPENEEKTRKHGCMIACILKKQNLIEGTSIKEAQVHSKINGLFDDSPLLGIAHRIARKCMKEARSITQECEKGFSLYACVAKSIHKLVKHEEHEREEIEETEEETTK